MSKASATSAALLALTVWLLPVHAHAEPGLHLRVGAVTNYLHRGVSQSDHEPALQASMEYQGRRGFYVGVWTSEVAFAFDDRDYEVDYFAGHQRRWSENIATDLTVVHYNYDMSPHGTNYDWSEGQFALHLGDRFTLLGAAAHNWLGRNTWSYVAEATIRQPLARHWIAHASLGRQLAKRAIDRSYTYFEIGVSRRLGPFDISLSYADSSGLGGFGAAASSELIAGIALSN